MRYWVQRENVALFAVILGLFADCSSSLTTLWEGKRGYPSRRYVTALLDQKGDMLLGSGDSLRNSLAVIFAGTSTEGVTVGICSLLEAAAIQAIEKEHELINLQMLTEDLTTETFDDQLSPSARSALAKFLRVTEHQIKALELRQQFLSYRWNRSVIRPLVWVRSE